MARKQIKPAVDGNAFSHGFSLIEVMIALVIISISMGALYTFFSSYTKANISQEVSVDVQQDVRSALAVMESDIKMAGFNPGEASSVGIEEAGADHVKFKSDRNMNGTVDSPSGIIGDATTATNSDFEYMEYKLDGSTVKQVLYDSNGDPYSNTGVTNPIVLADNVTNLSFVYYDENNNTTTDKSEVRSIEITLAISKKPNRNRLNITQVASTRVFCRNLGL